ncbi:MAG: SIMPL domain-containing protein [Gemmatimonadota bacterium]|nr:SIMPL domain-containing protein [Gemmatimonadota bacterium]
MTIVPTLSAQQPAINPPNEPPPQIITAARGEVRVDPDRATIQISVQTRAATAAAAASQNAAKQKAVFDALRALGLGADQLSTINYNVYPEQRYEPNREPVVVGYNVTNTLLVEVKNLSQVGPVIDAALSKGANMITSLQFYASNTDDARRTAIASAIQKARLDAEAAARAAGGSLAGLLEVSVGTHYAPPPRPLAMARGQLAAVAEQTPINPGEQTLSVDVTTRWRFR